MFFILVSFLFPAYVGLTLHRNYVYGDEVRLWSDVVRRAPGSDRAHSVLATNYLNKYDEKKNNQEVLDLAVDLRNTWQQAAKIAKVQE